MIWFRSRDNDADLGDTRLLKPFANRSSNAENFSQYTLAGVSLGTTAGSREKQGKRTKPSFKRFGWDRRSCEACIPSRSYPSIISSKAVWKCTRTFCLEKQTGVRSFDGWVTIGRAFWVFAAKKFNNLTRTDPHDFSIPYFNSPAKVALPYTVTDFSEHRSRRYVAQKSCHTMSSHPIRDLFSVNKQRKYCHCARPPATALMRNCVIARNNSLAGGTWLINLWMVIGGQFQIMMHGARRGSECGASSIKSYRNRALNLELIMCARVLGWGASHCHERLPLPSVDQSRFKAEKLDFGPTISGHDAWFMLGSGWTIFTPVMQAWVQTAILGPGGPKIVCHAVLMHQSMREMTARARFSLAMTL